MTDRLRLAQSFNETHDRRLIQIIYEAVQDGLSPWDPGRIALYNTQDALNGIQVAIRVERFPELVFSTRPDYILHDPTTMFLSIAEKAFKFYRYREGLPVEDHIILGEE